MNFQARWALLDFGWESALVALLHNLDFYAHHMLEGFPLLSPDLVFVGDVATPDDGLDRGHVQHRDRRPSPPFPSSGACWKLLSRFLNQKVAGDSAVVPQETSVPLLLPQLIVRQTQQY